MPTCSGPSSEGFPENIDYDFAQQELMLQQMGNDPIQEAISQIEKQHEEDKQGMYNGWSLPPVYLLAIPSYLLGYPHATF